MSGGLGRSRILARGAVQGVGFRPFVYVLATELGLNGYVLNSPAGVEIEVEGRRHDLDVFARRLRNELPAPGFLAGLETARLDPVGYTRFEIRPSDPAGARTTVILPDVATCPRCLAEVFDPKNRRHRYPFTNCTHCGPRFSIVLDLPYDRPNTTMRGFRMCPDCLREYQDPRDRRFHAQPNACPVCGPRLELWDPHGHPLTKEDGALLAACTALREGRIIAVKGIGGFHLMVDARNEEAVRNLRARKHREAKPLAVMVADLEAARALAEVGDHEEALLASPETPIVLLRARENELAPSVAPDNPNVGLLLPYSPLHHLLIRELGFPVVATSGNLSDEPICTDEREALARFRGIADLLLVHDRPIARPIDDSVARVMDGRTVVFRRARGYAPLPFAVPGATGGLVAVGAHLKNSVAISIPDAVVVGQHVGDLDHPSTRRRMEEECYDLARLFGVVTDRVVHDLHPDYASTHHAEALGHPRESVQHHVAHAVACRAENELNEPALAIVWDGTGYGVDATIWGGEALSLVGSQVRRVGRLRPFPLVGGDAAVREGRRAALGVLYAMDGNAITERFEDVLGRLFPSHLAVSRFVAVCRSGIACVATSSAGRLFDAAAALGAGIPESRFEGDAAMRFEALAHPFESEEPYPIALRETDGLLELDWQPTVEALIENARSRVAPGRIAARFHGALADGIVALAQNAGFEAVLLTGGCFQNRLLTEAACRRLSDEGFRSYLHQRIPPNDGGIAFGQAVAALQGVRLIQQESRPSVGNMDPLASPNLSF
ncbi:MAG: carbamoyltransferase HypF [Fimbriimonadaceae bacterium]|nr:carbamoyltransferase HypF [Fimbriimonadaceae bacterium]